MKCSNCEFALATDAKFCPSCGLKVGEVLKLQEEQPDIEKGVKTSNLDQIITVVAWIGGFALGRYLGLSIFIFLIAYFIGKWFPEWYLKKDKVNMSVVKLVVWSNLATWFLPPLGILTGFAALGFSNSFPGEKQKYKILAVVGIALALVNAAWGILNNI